MLKIHERSDRGDFYVYVVTNIEAKRRKQCTFPNRRAAERFVEAVTRDGVPAALEAYADAQADRRRRAALKGRAVVTLGTYMQERADNSTRVGTQRAYDGLVVRMTTAAPRVMARPVADLTARDLEALAAGLRAYRSKQAPNGLTPGGLAFAWKLVRACINSALQAGILDTDPLPKMKPGTSIPVRVEPNMPGTTTEDVEAIIARVREPELQALFMLCRWGAFRIGEAVALDWEDIVMKPGEPTAKIHVHRTMVRHRTKAEWFRGQTTKTDRERWVEVPRHVIVRLREAIPPFGGGAIFAGLDLTRNNTPGHVTLSTVDKSWERARNAAARANECRPGIRKHDTRHARICEWLRAGTSIKTVAAMAGHTNIMTTLAIYDHIMDTDQTNAALVGVAAALVGVA